MKFLERWEGYRSEAYPDGPRWSIGFGTKSFEGEVISREEAERRKLNILLRLDTLVVSDVDWLSLNQYVALVSFIYNVGEGAYRRSTLRRKLLAKDCSKAAEEFTRWVRVEGEVNDGLKRRREAEAAKFRGDCREE